MQPKLEIRAVVPGLESAPVFVSRQTASERGGGRSTLIHHESLGLEFTDHDVNVVSPFHPPAFV